VKFGSNRLLFPGSFILRRSQSSYGNYAVTVVQANGIKSYQVTDLGLGQVGLSTGQAFASLEDMLIFFYDMPFPDAGNGHVPLTIMHQTLVGVASSQEAAAAPVMRPVFPMGGAPPPVPNTPRPSGALPKPGTDGNGVVTYEGAEYSTVQ